MNSSFALRGLQAVILKGIQAYLYKEFKLFFTRNSRFSIQRIQALLCKDFKLLFEKEFKLFSTGNSDFLTRNSSFSYKDFKLLFKKEFKLFFTRKTFKVNFLSILSSRTKGWPGLALQKHENVHQIPVTVDQEPRPIVQLLVGLHLWGEEL